MTCACEPAVCETRWHTEGQPCCSACTHASRPAPAQPSRYCIVKRCRTNGAPTRLPEHDRTHTTCQGCHDRMQRWLKGIPETYTLLAAVVEPGSVDHNPDSKRGKRTTAPLPLRVEVIDLLDHRRLRAWRGTIPTPANRGALGVLLNLSLLVAQERGHQLPHDRPYTVTDATKHLLRHLDWITTQPLATQVHEDLRRLHRRLSDAIGEYRPLPVGHCHLVPDDSEDGKPCGGPLLANRWGGVRCGSCDATWDAAHLRQLGLAQAQAQATT